MGRLDLSARWRLLSRRLFHSLSFLHQIIDLALRKFFISTDLHTLDVNVTDFRTPQRPDIIPHPRHYPADLTIKTLLYCDLYNAFLVAPMQHLHSCPACSTFREPHTLFKLFQRLATDLTEVGTRPDGVEEHHSEIIYLTFAEVREALAAEAITDAKTLFGRQYVLARHDSSEISTG